MANANKSSVFKTPDTKFGADNDLNAHPLADKIKDFLHEAEDTLFEKAKSAEIGLRDTISKGSHNFDDQKAQLESAWRGSAVKRYAVENPVLTVSVAFAAGALVASLMRSK